MKFERIGRQGASDLTQLFRATFSASEGADEGALIGSLVASLAAQIDNEEICCFGALEDQQLVGAIFFTRLHFADNAPVYMLAPVAVSTGSQRSGVGQALISHGLDQLANHGVRVVVTYGDPAYYEKVGFKPLAENVLRAPLELSMPHGWLGQSLTDEPIAPREGRPVCVNAFRDPVYW